MAALLPNPVAIKLLLANVAAIARATALLNPAQLRRAALDFRITMAWPQRGR